MSTLTFQDLSFEEQDGDLDVAFMQIFRFSLFKSDLEPLGRIRAQGNSSMRWSFHLSTAQVMVVGTVAHPAATPEPNRCVASIPITSVTTP